jgi:UDP-N-acetyl-D-galactosamine dehydrogenase
MENVRICVIGLGYVGLPIARLFSTKYKTIGFDIDNIRVGKLMTGHDDKLEISDQLLHDAIHNHGFICTSDLELIRESNFYVVAVPTPVDINNTPDLSSLKHASRIVGTVIKKGDVVVYESTVYPGATEEVCIPIIESESGLLLNKDFWCGYSPERINPGDKQHTVEQVKKIVAGSTLESARFINEIYSSVIQAGTYLVSSIKVAEAAKVIENSQRDINIAFVNELSKIFHLMNIDTLEVIEAAATKWNFLSFQPGLVGGHCVGVDSYYLAQAAIRLGYYPEIILAGRRINNSMGQYIANETIKLMLRKGIQVLNAKVLILGFTFKENCPDVRNTMVVDIYNALKEYALQVSVYDPWADPSSVFREYKINMETKLSFISKYDACIVAVSHKEFATMDLYSLLKDKYVIFDVKGILDRRNVDGRL